MIKKQKIVEQSFSSTDATDLVFFQSHKQNIFNLFCVCVFCNEQTKHLDIIIEKVFLLTLLHAIINEIKETKDSLEHKCMFVSGVECRRIIFWFC